MTLQGFTEVAQRFNNAKLVACKTDGKHCKDRFKLLITRLSSGDEERANNSRQAEEYGEFEQLCPDLVTEIDDFKAEKEAARTEARQKKEELLVAEKLKEIGLCPSLAYVESSQRSRKMLTASVRVSMLELIRELKEKD